MVLMINISSDDIHILGSDEECFVPRTQVATKYWPELLHYLRRHDARKIIVLNGPGGFTNLRVGTLVLNILNRLLLHDHNQGLELYTIGKLEIYQYAYQKGRLPPRGILYIGQQHNVWDTDLQTEISQKIRREEIDYDTELFLDRMHIPYRQQTTKMVRFQVQDDKLYLIYQDTSYDLTDKIATLPKSLMISPQYMIEPTIS